MIDREAPKRLGQPRAGARGWRNSMKSTPDEGERRLEEALASLERYIPLTASALAPASGISFRADEVTADGKGNFASIHFTSIHFTSVESGFALASEFTKSLIRTSRPKDIQRYCLIDSVLLVAYTRTK